MDYLSIIELKKNEINDETLIQLEDYLKERNQLIEKYPEYWSENENKPEWIGVLVGSSISPELQMKLQKGYQTEDGIPIAGMTIKRFRGQNNEIYVTSDTFFKYNYSIRDFSKASRFIASFCFAFCFLFSSSLFLILSIIRNAKGIENPHPTTNKVIIITAITRPAGKI